jgi:c-di-GMP-binding flagellar brake protein YcgR
MLQVGYQKRLSFRIKVEWPVTIETARGSVEGKTKDISAGGAHIRCTEYLQLHEPVSMTIEAPDRKPLKVAAIVIWSDIKDESNRPRVIGVKFADISAEDREYLEQVALEDFKAKLPE